MSSPSTRPIRALPWTPARRPACTRASAHPSGFTPPALVTTVEELFGLALCTPDCYDGMEEALAAGARLCEPWQRLHRIMLDLVGKRGSFAKADVIGQCDDGELCELVSRASTRAAAEAGDAEVNQILNRVEEGEAAPRTLISFDTGEKVKVTFKVLGRDYQPVAGAHLRVHLESADGTSMRIDDLVTGDAGIGKTRFLRRVRWR